MSQSTPAPIRPARLTLRGFVATVQREVFDLDRGLLGTWVQLWMRPGATLRRYVEWRDPRLTPPVRYALLLLAVSALLLHGFDISVDFQTGVAKGLMDASENAAEDRGWTALVSRHLDVWLYLAALPAMAAALDSTYRARLNVAEALAISTYVLAQVSLGITLLLVALELSFGIWTLASAWLWPLYFGVACWGYFAADGLGFGRALGATVLFIFYGALFTLLLAFVSMGLAQAVA